MFTSLLVCAALVTVNDGVSNGKVAKADLKKTALSVLESEVGDISGYYTCKGMEVGGKVYNGVAVISRKGDVYVVQWMVGSGSTFTGIGIRQSNVLAASWALPGPNGAILKGINMYRIESSTSGPRLVGRWTSMPGPGVLQSETLTFLKAMEKEE